MSVLTGLVGIAAGLACLIGAYFWFSASNMPVLTQADWSGDAEMNRLSREADLLSQLADMGRKNAVGARWTGVGALLAGLASLLSLVG